MGRLTGGFIRAQIAKYIGPEVSDVTLIRIVPGTRTVGAQSNGTNPTSTSYPCKGFQKGFKDGQLSSTLIKVNDRSIRIVGGTLPDGVIPEPGDKVTIDGDTYRIIGGDDGLGVSFDPDKAMFRCHGRR